MCCVHDRLQSEHEGCGAWLYCRRITLVLSILTAVVAAESIGDEPARQYNQAAKMIHTHSPNTLLLVVLSFELHGLHGNLSKHTPYGLS